MTAPTPRRAVSSSATTSGASRSRPGAFSELTATQPVTAEMWFKTGWNGSSTHYDYLLEWLKMGNTGSGMSIAVQDGRLQIYLNPWVDAGAVTPNTWYHVAVAKEPGHVRIYLNGQRVYTGINPQHGAAGDRAHARLLGVPHRRGGRQLRRLPERRDQPVPALACRTRGRAGPQRVPRRQQPLPAVDADDVTRQAGDAQGGLGQRHHPLPGSAVADRGSTSRERRPTRRSRASTATRAAAGRATAPQAARTVSGSTASTTWPRSRRAR